MDDFERDHLLSWVNANYPPHEGDEVYEKIKAFVEAHPRVMEFPPKSWPEIRDLIERNEEQGIGSRRRPSLTKNQLEQALRDHFGPDVYGALIGSRIALPRICEMAAVNLFIQQPSLSHEQAQQASIIRHALANLRGNGCFDFEEDS